MNLSNQLPVIWQAILCVRDALKITRRVLIHSLSRLPEDSYGASRQKKYSQSESKFCPDVSENIAILPRTGVHPSG